MGFMKFDIYLCFLGIKSRCWLSTKSITTLDKHPGLPLQAPCMLAQGPVMHAIDTCVVQSIQRRPQLCFGRFDLHCLAEKS